MKRDDELAELEARVAEIFEAALAATNGSDSEEVDLPDYVPLPTEADEHLAIIFPPRRGRK